LLATAGETVTKDALIAAAWDVAVTDNSLEQVISSLRRALGERDPGAPWIETVPRRGYRFTGDVRKRVGRESDDALDALLAPHRAFIEGRAALESLDAGRLDAARRAFEEAVKVAPDLAAGHIGVANARVMQFETSRALPNPDRAALEVALRHAREACRLDPRSSEAWATLGLILDRSGGGVDAMAAARRAVTLDPGNWRHYFRLSTIAWGEERLGAAHRALALLPGLPLAHWMAATVHVARQTQDAALRELEAGLAAGPADADTPASPFRPVALHWLQGLIALSRGDMNAATAAFEAEIAGAESGHLYARESAANAWYALGAARRRQQRPADAAAAFEHALRLVPGHPMAEACLGRPAATISAQLAQLVIQGATAQAAALVSRALAAAEPGSTLWFLPVEPLLAVYDAPDLWAPALRRLRARAA
jgi:tetratricopeptide (TPR) repeat protein